MEGCVGSLFVAGLGEELQIKKDAVARSVFPNGESFD
jgi:hypothetical protein